jgi:hypothetical protein
MRCTMIRRQWIMLITRWLQSLPQSSMILPKTNLVHRMFWLILMNIPGAVIQRRNLSKSKSCTFVGIPMPKVWNFSSRVRLAFAASGFVQILINFVIGELNKNDMEWVLARATQSMRVFSCSWKFTFSQFTNEWKPTYPYLRSSNL